VSGRAAAALALIALVALPAARVAAQDDAAGVAFRAASQQLAAGDLEGAQAAFEAVNAMDPRGPWADDALSEAAEIAERRNDLATARRLWRRVVDEYPSSRQVRRARVRVAALEHAIGAGGQWLAVAQEHERILAAAVTKSDPTHEVHALTELLDAHPGYPRAHEARMWIGNTWLRLGFPRRAAIAYRDARAVAADGDERWRAGKALADALRAGGNLDAAEREYRALLGTADPLSDRVVAGELEQVDTLRARARLTVLAWIALAGALGFLLVHAWRAAGGVRAAARALARPPLEVWYFLPPAAVLFAVALTGNYLIARAVRSILVGGLAITWLTGASLAAARPRRATVVAAHVGAALIAVAAVCYLAIVGDQLIDLLRETWQHGPER